MTTRLLDQRVPVRQAAHIGLALEREMRHALQEFDDAVCECYCASLCAYGCVCSDDALNDYDNRARVWYDRVRERGREVKRVRSYEDVYRLFKMDTEAVLVAEFRISSATFDKQPVGAQEKFKRLNEKRKAVVSVMEKLESDRRDMVRTTTRVV